MKLWKKLALAGAAACLIITAGCGKEEKPAASAPAGKVPVTVSFGAMKELTQAIGGDRVAITVIIPAGTEPHEFEPKASDMMRVKDSKVFIYNGMGMERWAPEMLKSMKDGPVAVVASKGIDPIRLTDEDEIKEHGDFDPHVWLGPEEARKEAKNIADALAAASPENKEYFEKNYEKLDKDLTAMTEEYKKKLSTGHSKELVAGHAAFGYLCRDFGLTQASVEDAFASGEPSPAKLADIIDFCKKHNVKTIFTEDMISPALTETISKEAGAKVETLDTIESGEQDANYVKTMKENLEKIDKGLALN